VLDDEIVFLSQDGRPQFYDLIRRRGPQWFYGFDLLSIDGRDLRDLPQIARKAELRRAVRADGTHLRYVDHVENSGIELFQTVYEMDL
jgi:bifunctional non-homologous end joining protein LigD